MSWFLPHSLSPNTGLLTHSAQLHWLLCSSSNTLTVKDYTVAGLLSGERSSFTSLESLTRARPSLAAQYKQRTHLSSVHCPYPLPYLLFPLQYLLTQKKKLLLNQNQKLTKDIFVLQRTDITLRLRRLGFPFFYLGKHCDQTQWKFLIDPLCPLGQSQVQG